MINLAIATLEGHLLLKHMHTEILGVFLQIAKMQVHSLLQDIKEVSTVMPDFERTPSEMKKNIF